MPLRKSSSGNFFFGSKKLGTKSRAKAITIVKAIKAGQARRKKKP